MYNAFHRWSLTHYLNICLNLILTLCQQQISKVIIISLWNICETFVDVSVEYSTLVSVLRGRCIGAARYYIIVDWFNSIWWTSSHKYVLWGRYFRIHLHVCVISYIHNFVIINQYTGNYSLGSDFTEEISASYLYIYIYLYIFKLFY